MHSSEAVGLVLTPEALASVPQLTTWMAELIARLSLHPVGGVDAVVAEKLSDKMGDLFPSTGKGPATKGPKAEKPSGGRKAAAAEKPSKAKAKGDAAAAEEPSEELKRGKGKGKERSSSPALPARASSSADDDKPPTARDADKPPTARKKAARAATPDKPSSGPASPGTKSKSGGGKAKAKGGKS